MICIYRRGDYVVVDEGRVGLVNRYFYEETRRRYVVQFGAAGPFEQVSPERMRFATTREERDLEVFS
jgi:hypothetical protein